MEDDAAYMAVAESEGTVVVGYVLAFCHQTLYANGPVAWVEEIMVNAEHRKQGVGRELMNAAEQWTAGRGCKLVALATRRASNFYESLGYEASATYYRKLI
jgi:GNAT superfamily N-acetyltransferase